MTDLGEIQSYLGVNITRDRASCTMDINQTDYIESVVERFEMRDSNPVYTPLVKGFTPLCPTWAAFDSDRLVISSLWIPLEV